MSIIQGEGYGSCHLWTDVTNDKDSKNILYQCFSCGREFTRYGYQTGSMCGTIFEADIPDTCVVHGGASFDVLDRLLRNICADAVSNRIIDATDDEDDILDTGTADEGIEQAGISTNALVYALQNKPQFRHFNLADPSLASDSEVVSGIKSQSKNTRKSAITGSGYGSSHCWIRAGTAQVGSWGIKQSNYVCGVCDEQFAHYYDQVPRIHDAMLREGVRDQCVPSAERSTAHVWCACGGSSWYQDYQCSACGVWVKQIYGVHGNKEEAMLEDCISNKCRGAGFYHEP